MREAAVQPRLTLIAASPSPAASPTVTEKGTAAAPVHETVSGSVPISFGQPVVLSGHTHAVTHLSWSPGGEFLASSCGEFDSQDDSVRLWKPDGTLAAALAGHTGPVTDLAWSPDGKILATSSLDGTIRLWHPDGGLLRILEGHAGRVFAVAWSPDGRVLASGAIVEFLNPTVQLWDPNGKIQQTLSTSFSGGKFYNLRWSPDGKYLVGGATDYKLWQADRTLVYWMTRSERSAPAWGMAWSPNSQYWAVGNESGLLSIFNTSGEQVAAVQDQSGINSIAWSPDSLKLASGKTIWRADGTVVNTLINLPEYVNSLAWSPDGRILAVGGSDNLIHLFAPDGKPLAALSGHSKAIRAVAWSPNGKILASAAEDQTIRLWTLR